MKKFVVITADHNDGDYVTEKTEIGDSDILQLKEILAKMPREKLHTGGIGRGIRYETRDIGDDDKKDSDYQFITPEEKEFLSDYLPSGDENYSGIHTIEEVVIFEEIEVLV